MTFPIHGPHYRKAKIDHINSECSRLNLLVDIKYRKRHYTEDSDYSRIWEFTFENKLDYHYYCLVATACNMNGLSFKVKENV